MVTANPTITSPKTKPEVETGPQRRYHPDVHCPSQKERLTRTVRRILTTP